ncbi:flavin reductase family protein [Mycolicibacterium sp.]|uniref:flavin reductase family protein n=2 Tax=Mycobacteriaceae TaxID=1762 RepID=UPI0037CA19AE
MGAAASFDPCLVPRSNCGAGMRIVLQRGHGTPDVSVESSEDFTKLSLEIAADVHPFEIAHARGVKDIDPSGTHVWFTVDVLRDLCQVYDESLDNSFDQMISKAAAHGWVADGSVRVHIATGGDSAQEGSYAPMHPGESSLKDVFRTMPSGVLALAGMPELGQPVVMAVSSFTNVSMRPPLLGVCIRRESATWPQLAKSPNIGVSLLASSQGSLALELSAPDQGTERLSRIDYVTTNSGAVYIRDAVSWCQTRLFETHRGGDHLIALLEIERCAKSVGSHPVVYYESGFRAIAGA